MPETELALLRHHNETSRPFDLTRDADAQFRAQADATPSAPAILDPSGRTIGYARFDALVSAMAANESWPLHAMAATLTTGRDVLEVRAAIVAHSRQELLDALRDGGGMLHGRFPPTVR